MLAAKHFDPSIGVDIHIILTPAGVPVPIPHPHISIVMDFMDYVPKIGSTVKVGGVPRATAGTAGRPIPHFPIGGSFTKPPGNEDEMFMGSATVLADQAPFTFTALPVISCHDVGMMAPVRKKKPKKSFGMVLPTTFVMPLPLGRPVLVGGPPTIDMMGLVMNGAFSALGGAFKKMRKMQKKSKRFKKLSDALHGKTKKLMDKLGVPPNVQNKVHKGICTVTGHPVDIATGKLFTDYIDIELPGPLPFIWERTWYSCSTYQGALGHGWHHSYDMSLAEEGRAVAVRLNDGRAVGFPSLDTGEECFNQQEHMTLKRDERGYALITRDGLVHRFASARNNATQKSTEDRNKNKKVSAHILPLTTIEDRTGHHRIQFFYRRNEQKHDLLTKIIDSAGRPIHLHYNNHGQLHQIWLPHPDPKSEQATYCAVEYTYQHGDLVHVTYPMQQSLHYVYQHHLLVKETQRDGLNFYFEFDRTDHHAKCTRTWGDGGLYDRRLSYQQGRTNVIDSLGYLTIYEHNGVLATKITDAKGAASTLTYNDAYQIIKEEAPDGAITEYNYDERGNLSEVNYPTGNSLSITYNALDLPTKLTDIRGHLWLWAYDQHGQRILECDPQDNHTRYEYDQGQLARIIDENGDSITLTYDAHKNLVGLTRYTQDKNATKVQGFNTTHWHYDRLGNLIHQQDPRGNERHLCYDLQQRIRKVKEADGNLRTFDYDHEDRVIHVKDNDYDVRFRYTGFGRLKSRAQNGVEITFDYNTEDELIGIRNEGGHLYQFELDEVGELLSETGFDGRHKRYIRDKNSRLLRIQRPAERFTQFDYDPQGRTRRIDYSDGDFEAFRYNSVGDLIEATTQHNQLTLERDAFGRLIKETQKIKKEDKAYWVASDYNRFGERVRMHSSLGADMAITRNQQGDVIHLKANHHETRFERDELGLEMARHLPGGLQSRWSRDKLGRPLKHSIQCKHHGHAIEKSTSYVWSTNDRLMRTIDDQGIATDYQYDPVGTLIGSRDHLGHFNVRMPDALGNLFNSYHQNDRDYGAAGQLLVKREKHHTTHYHYDEEGNLVHKIRQKSDSSQASQNTQAEEWRYRWSDRGHLSEIILPSGESIRYHYDAFGRRIQQTNNQGTKYWVWDSNNPLHEWLVPAVQNTEKQQVPAPRQGYGHLNSGTTLQPIQAQAPPAHTSTILKPWEQEGSLEKPITWYFEPDTMVPMGKKIGEHYYSILTDHLGTPKTMLDAKGEAVWNAKLSIWGTLNTKDTPTACPFRWPGQYDDGNTGLYYNRFRYYDPDMGQYVSQDPIGLLGGMRVYGYVEDTNGWLDLFGLAKSSTYGSGSKAKGKAGTQRWSKKVTKAGKPYKKPGPKVNGGPHNDKIEEIIKREAAKGNKHVGGGNLTELVIDTPGGMKSTRRPDASFEDKSGSIYHYNVGRKNARAGNELNNVDPIIREREALADLRAAGEDIKFEPYTP